MVHDSLAVSVVLLIFINIIQQKFGFQSKSISFNVRIYVLWTSLISKKSFMPSWYRIPLPPPYASSIVTTWQ
jgi:hypothetical protein